VSQDSQSGSSKPSPFPTFSTCGLVSPQDLTPSQGRGYGDYWVLAYLCQFSHLDFWISKCIFMFHWLASRLVRCCTIQLDWSELRQLIWH